MTASDWRGSQRLRFVRELAAKVESKGAEASEGYTLFVFDFCTVILIFLRENYCFGAVAVAAKSQAAECFQDVLDDVKLFAHVPEEVPLVLGMLFSHLIEMVRSVSGRQYALLGPAVECGGGPDAEVEVGDLLKCEHPACPFSALGIDIPAWRWHAAHSDHPLPEELFSP